MHYDKRQRPPGDLFAQGEIDIIIDGAFVGRRSKPKFPEAPIGGRLHQRRRMFFTQRDQADDFAFQLGFDKP